MAETIQKIMDDKKGIDIQVINLEGKTVLADYFVSSRPEHPLPMFVH